MNREEHWDTLYRTKGERDVSWFEQLPVASLQMIEAAGLSADTCIVDVGGGESRLVDELLARGLHCLAAVTGEWSLKPMDSWHDRATFHFLIDPDDRRRYVMHLRETLKLRGSAIIATFAPDGPERCSGLPVARYSPVSLSDELGDGFTLIESHPHHHTTPDGTIQSFQYSRFQRVS